MERDKCRHRVFISLSWGCPGSAQQAFFLLLFEKKPCLSAYYDTVIHTALSAHQALLIIN